VAIKIIDTCKIGNAQDIDMVFREAELMKSLRHKNIVKIMNCYTLPNMQVVIIMEYLQGGELLEYLEGIVAYCLNRAWEAS
jgi:MAP/microtubule affinity-regulating kinase